MTLYRKRPVEVDMIQWTGGNADEIQSWADDLCESNVSVRTVHVQQGGTDPSVLVLWVAKSESYCAIEGGGWVAQERDGDGFYPITEAEQAATYDKVDPEADARALYERSSLFPDLEYMPWPMLPEEHRAHFRARIAEEGGR